MVLHLELKLAIYKPLSAASYVPLPKDLAAKHAIVNVQNSDNKCFLWSVLASLYPVTSNPQRVSNYIHYENELKTQNMTFPVTIKQIPNFENDNFISINVFGYEKEIFPLYITKQSFDKHVNLLLISNGENQHYCWIKNISSLLFNLTNHQHAVYYCNYCLHRFKNRDAQIEHSKHCQNHEIQKIKLPDENNKWLTFTNYHQQLKVPFIIYADFESILEKKDYCLPNPSHSSLTAINIQVPCGYGYITVGYNGEFFKPPVVYRGPDAIHHFLERLLEEEDIIQNILSTVEPMIFDDDDKLLFESATVCHICEKPLNNDSVRDHCHLSGKFRGAAHSRCNLNYKFQNFIPVVFHNFRGYDCHLLLQAIGKIKDRKIRCIPNNSEKFTSVTLGTLRFIDSLLFLNTSIEKLVSNLDPNQMKLTNSFFGEKAPLMLRKGVYPYEYMDSFSKFHEEKLPPLNAFYSTLTHQNISENDYAHAHNVWKSFNLKTLGEYHDTYLCSDVLLLADIFENFRELALKFYKIDPAHHYTAPGLAWQAALRMSEVKLELFTDLDMHLFIERGIRGGVAMISHRHSRANNNDVPGYDNSEPNKYILYLDANNLYGWSMCQPLPTHDFEWIYGNVDYMNIPDDSPIEYILEVDIEYPEYLHDLHNDYPLAPEKMNITTDMLSEYNKKIAKSLNIKLTTCTRLVPNLLSKNNYVVHYRNLKQYKSFGLEVTKIHRSIKFQQMPWLKKYIDFNTHHRKKANSQFEKDLFKLLNNAVFGKTIENLRNRRRIELIQNEQIAKKRVSSPSFHSYKIINEDLTSIEIKNTSLLLNRPIHAGFSILDISKTLINEFHYKHIKSKYGKNAILLFTDTDSLCYEITTENVYNDMHENLHLYDTSDYPENIFPHSVTNKKVLGKMKDECIGQRPTEFVGLKPKMYSLLVGNKEKRVGKGIPKFVLQNTITHNDYLIALYNNVRNIEESVRISSKNHKLHTENIRKVTLNAFDVKRHILDDGVATLAYGHYQIPMLQDWSNDDFL